MTILLFASIIFLSLIEWVIIIDVVLSMISMFGIHFHPVWIERITSPLYGSIRRVIPTSIGNMDFTAIIIFVLIELMSNIILRVDPNILSALSR